MNKRTAYVLALSAALAGILCVSGALLWHQDTKQPETYEGGTERIDFAEGLAHTAGDAVLIPAVPTVWVEGTTIGDESDADAGVTEDMGNAADEDSEEFPVGADSAADTPGKAHNAKESSDTSRHESAVVRNEHPGNVWAEEERSGSTSGTGSTGSYTTRTQLPAADSIGTLKIPGIGLTVNAYDSANQMEDMDKGVSHFQITSYWDGNVAFAGHNGNLAYSYFGRLHNVKAGDTITYTTSLGTRTYTVTNIWMIADDDWSHLERTDDNRLTLITCVSDPARRLCVQAVER